MQMSDGHNTYEVSVDAGGAGDGVDGVGAPLPDGGDAIAGSAPQTSPQPGPLRPMTALTQWLADVRDTAGVDAVSVVATDNGGVRIEIVGVSLPGYALTRACAGPCDNRIVALHTTDAGLLRCCLSLDRDCLDADDVPELVDASSLAPD